MVLTHTAPTTSSTSVTRLDAQWGRHDDTNFSTSAAKVIALPDLSDDDKRYIKLFAEFQRKHPGRKLFLVQWERTMFPEEAEMTSGESLAFYARKYRNDPRLMLFVL